VLGTTRSHVHAADVLVMCEAEARFLLPKNHFLFING
jgi:hypothetical protein